MSATERFIQELNPSLDDWIWHKSPPAIRVSSMEENSARW
jgi:hypothetical protein